MIEAKQAAGRGQMAQGAHLTWVLLWVRWAAAARSQVVSKSCWLPDRDWTLPRGKDGKGERHQVNKRSPETGVTCPRAARK